MLAATGTALSAGGASATASADATVERWRTTEIELTARANYNNPFDDVTVNAVFTGPGGRTITRPAFWDGRSTWKVRFAPPDTGTWTMTTTASNSQDTGLNGVHHTINAVPYTGDKKIYQRGFLKPSNNGHHLQYADGTPFLYLGDTHWILPHERFDTSNAPGVASQFKYVVDKRVKQGFTAYQSEPIWQPHGGTHTGADEEAVADLTDGMQAADLPGFANLDRKFKYIADAGLVHSNAMISWVKQPAENPEAMTADFMAKMGRYWDARYGSYPAIWTVGQELDKDMYGTYPGDKMAPWSAAINALDDADSYDQPIMPHQENTASTNAGNSRFASEPWHTGFASQWQQTDGWDQNVAQQYWDTGEPTLNYEAPYEDFWTDSRHALSAFYKSYLLGMRGYGYGVSGGWNDVYSAPGEPLDAGTEYELPERYQWWYTGANRNTADQLGYGMEFFSGLKWWELTPRFRSSDWTDFGDNKDAYLASDGNTTYVALFADGTQRGGAIKGMDPQARYNAQWIDPRTGQRYDAGTGFTPTSGSRNFPNKPNTDDFVLLVEKA